MAADSSAHGSPAPSGELSRARGLLGELRGCLTKMGQAVEDTALPSTGSSLSNGRRTPEPGLDAEERVAAAEKARQQAVQMMNEAIAAREAAERRAEEAEQAKQNVQQLLSWVHEAEKKKKEAILRQDSGGREGFQTALKLAVESEERDFSMLDPDEFMLRKVFDRWDTDRNGSLSLEELKHALEQLQLDVSDGEFASLMSWLDVDGNAQIDFDEFKRAALAPSQVQQWLSSMPLLKLIASAFPGGYDAAPLSQVAQLTEKEVRSKIAGLIDDLTTLVVHHIAQLKRALDRSGATGPDERPATAEGVASKFTSAGMQIEHEADAAGGLERRVGEPARVVLGGMEVEHVASAGAEVEFEAGGVRTTPAREWRLATGAGAEERAGAEGGRVLKSLREHRESERVRRAGLRDEELLAIVLYSGPMGGLYNAALRQPPPQLLRPPGDNRYASTVHALQSGLLKMMAAGGAVADGTWLYQGLREARLPAEAFKAHRSGAAGFTDPAFLSTTSDLAVARAAAARRQQPAVLALQTSSHHRGVCIAELSQFPAEAEVVWLPRCRVTPLAGGEHLRVTEDGPVTLLPVSVTLAALPDTLEQLSSRRKRSVLALLEALASEALRDAEAARCRWRSRGGAADAAGEHGLDEIKRECAELVEKFEARAAEWYLDDAQMASAVTGATELPARWRAQIKQIAEQGIGSAEDCR